MQEKILELHWQVIASPWVYFPETAQNEIQTINGLKNNK